MGRLMTLLWGNPSVPLEFVPVADRADDGIDEPGRDSFPAAEATLDHWLDLSA